MGRSEMFEVWPRMMEEMGATRKKFLWEDRKAKASDETVAGMDSRMAQT